MKKIKEGEIMFYDELMEIFDSNEEQDTKLYHLKNDIFDTVVLVYHEDTSDEEVYVLADMQGAYPESLEDAEDFDWVRAEDVEW